MKRLIIIILLLTAAVSCASRVRIGGGSCRYDAIYTALVAEETYDRVQIMAGPGIAGRHAQARVWSDRLEDWEWLVLIGWGVYTGAQENFRPEPIPYTIDLYIERVRMFARMIRERKKRKK